MSSVDKNQIPKLKEGNYEEWSLLLKALLVGKELWEVVDPEAVEVSPKAGKGVKARLRKDQQAMAAIVLSVDATQLPFITDKTTARDSWITLRNVHRSYSVNSILSLRRRFFRMRKSESESTLDFVSRVRKAALELSHTPCPTSEIDQILVITDGLPSEYAPVVTTLDNMPFENLKLLDVTSRIMGLEAQVSRAKEKASEVEDVSADTAFIARRGSGLMKCWNCGGVGHTKNTCPSPPQGQEHAKIAEVTADPFALAPESPDLTASIARLPIEAGYIQA